MKFSKLNIFVDSEFSDISAQILGPASQFTFNEKEQTINAFIGSIEHILNELSDIISSSKTEIFFKISLNIEKIEEIWNASNHARYSCSWTWNLEESIVLIWRTEAFLNDIPQIHKSYINKLLWM